jgi:transposase
MRWLLWNQEGSYEVMKAYSQDLRERIVRARLSGQSTAEVAHLFTVSPTVVRRYLARHRQGLSLAPGQAPGALPRVAPEQEAAFVSMLEENVNWTINALVVEWERRSGVLLPRSTLHGHVKRLKGRFKKDGSSSGTL